MALLVLFGFVAGAATAVSPCVLPVLPVAFAAGATGGRRRPLGVVLGLVASFTFATIAVVYVLSALGLPDDFFRTLAIVVLGLAGTALIVPAAAARVEARLSRLAPRAHVRPGGDGFGSGLLLGVSLGLVYAVAQDNDFATWRAYGNQYWPAKYLIDARGRVRYVHFGEGKYDATEGAIRSLLAEAGHEQLGRHARARVETPGRVATPESYLGSERAARFLNGAIGSGTHDFELPRRAVAALPPHHLAYEGRWRIDASHASAGAAGARLHLRFYASRVFLVLGGSGRSGGVRVALDGRPRRTLTVTDDRLYELVRLPRPGDHLLTLTLGPGTEAYAFTFG